MSIFTAVAVSLRRQKSKHKIMSDKKEINEELHANDSNGEANGAPEVENQETATEQEEAGWDVKYAELNDKFLRLYSEFDNYRKRTNKEKIDLISTANAGILKDLIPVIDDFERAIANNETAEDVEVLKEGFKLIHHKFKSTLEAKGLKEMQSVGLDFDSELHEAIANVPAPSDDQKGKVIDDVEKGYYLNEKVVRYAKVVVGQ